MRSILLILSFFYSFISSGQELLANVQINYAQVGGSNTQVYKSLEKNLRDFINNTSWTGRKLQNFEKIKSNFSIIITDKTGSNTFRGSIVVQAVRPVYRSQYESPLININDTNFSFEYTENENLVFNERQFSGKNLIDVISFYVYIILGYDADSFQNKGGQPWFEKAQKISQNAQNNNYKGWSVMEGNRTRAALVDNLLKPENNMLRQVFYNYHRNGLDLLYQTEQNQGKRSIAEALLQLKYYDNNFQMNYPFNIFISTKKDEIFNLFYKEKNAAINISELKNMMSLFAPKDIDSKWSKWK